MADVINLPPTPGLPDLYLSSGAAAVPLLTADDPTTLAALGPSIWGIFDPQTGAPVVIPQTVMEMGYSKASAISSYPIESGGFSDYDKQAIPFEGRVRLVAGGSAAARQTLLESIEAIEDDTNLYDLATPDRIYLNCNLTKMEYNRTATAGGASLLVIDVGVQEIRLLSSSGLLGSPTVDPASEDSVNVGAVQALPATPAQIAALTAGPLIMMLPTTLGGSFAGVTLPSTFTGGGG